jgi:Fe-S cluster biogenesis protein NfuA
VAGGELVANTNKLDLAYHTFNAQALTYLLFHGACLGVASSKATLSE